MKEILERLVRYGYTWLSVRNELQDHRAAYLSEDEAELLTIIKDAEKALEGEK